MYYVMTGEQLGDNYGGWVDADLSCEAESPAAAKRIFDEVFSKENKCRRVKTMAEYENRRIYGGLEPE